MKKQEDTITTYTLALINNWPSISDIIRDYSQNQITKSKDTSHASNEPTALITAKQITTALCGPYASFIQRQLKAYSCIMRFRLTLTIEQDSSIQETLKQSVITDNKNPIDPDKLKKLSPKILDDMLKELSELATQQNTQWQTCYQTWINQLIQVLAKENITLTDAEINELTQYETPNELFKGYKERSIQLPKDKEKTQTFYNYIILRIKPAIINTLSRQQQPHEENIIKNILKKINSNFNAIKKEEENTQKEQKKAIDEIIFPLL